MKWFRRLKNKTERRFFEWLWCKLDYYRTRPTGLPLTNDTFYEASLKKETEIVKGYEKKN